MSDTIDTKITELFNVLKNKKAEVEAAETESKKKWVTTCAFRPVFSTNGQPINIQTQQEDVLVDLLGELLIQDECATRAAKLLGNTTYKGGTWCGFKIEDWIEDFKTRIAKIQLVDKKKQLADLEKRLNAIVSPEQRRVLEMEAIMKDLGVKL